MECIEKFLLRAFMVNDKYSIAQQDPLKLSDSQLEEYPKTFPELEQAIDITIGYQDIVFRAVYLELNALVELELRRLAKSILINQGKKLIKLNRKKACCIIESEYEIKMKSLPCFEEVDEIRKIANAYKHSDGFKSDTNELLNKTTLKLGHQKKRYELSFDKAKNCIKAVKEYMKALPGERQDMYEMI